MNYLIEGDLVDTVGGWTYIDVWYEIEDNKFYLYRLYSGVREDEFNEDGKLIGVYDTIEEVNEVMNKSDYY